MTDIRIAAAITTATLRAQIIRHFEALNNAARRGEVLAE
jgi:hypothetical protein